MGKICIADFETLDTRPRAAVTALSVLVFDPTEGKSFEELVADTATFKLNWQEQIQRMQRTTSESTLDWWRNPDLAEAFDAMVKPRPDDMSILHLNDALTKYLVDNGFPVGEECGRWYTRGHMDLTIMEDIGYQLGRELPLRFWSWRDIRTEIDACMSYTDDHDGRGYIKGFNIDGLIKHNAAHDCAYDALQMCAAHVKLITALQQE